MDYFNGYVPIIIIIIIIFINFINLSKFMFKNSKSVMTN